MIIAPTHALAATYISAYGSRPQNERLDIFTLMESPVSALPTGVQHLAPQGTLILSGFFTDDVQEMTTVAEQNGLTVSQTLQRNNWAVLVLKS